MEITQSTSAATLKSVAPIESMYAQIGANVVMLLAFIGAAVVLFVILWGLVSIFKRLVRKEKKIKVIK